MATERYEVSLRMNVPDLTPDEVEDMLVRLVDLLTEEAKDLALGTTGAIHGPILELVFMVEATDTAGMYSKLHDVARVLQGAGGIDFSSTTARREDRELALV